MILNPSRTHSTFSKPHCFHKHLLKLHHTRTQRNKCLEKKGIEYTWRNQRLKFKITRQSYSTLEMKISFFMSLFESIKKLATIFKVYGTVGTYTTCF